MLASAHSSQITSLQGRASRLRDALVGCGTFFAAGRRADPLPVLHELAAEWLQAEELTIVVPSGTGLLWSEEPDRLVGPVLIGRRTVGRIEARRARAFDEDDRALLQALGQLIGAMLDQSSLQGQIEQYASQVQANAQTLDQLLDFGRRVVAGAIDSEQLALQLATQVPAMVGGERASLLLLPPDAPDAPVLVLSNGTIVSPDRAREVRAHGLAGLVLADRAPVMIDETDTDRRWLGLKLSRNDSRTRCAMATPLIWGEQLLGALTVTTTHSRLFNTPQLNLLELIACHIALAVQTANLEAHLRRLSGTLGVLAGDLEMLVNAARAGTPGALEAMSSVVARLRVEQATLRGRPAG